MSIIPDVGAGRPDEELARQLAAVPELNSYLGEDHWHRETYAELYGSGRDTLEEWIGKLTGNLRTITGGMRDAAGFTLQMGPAGVTVTVTFTAGQA